MKNYFILFIGLILNLNLFAQQEELTNEKIWKDRLFAPKYVNGFYAMLDGEHYSQITTIEGEQFITKNSITSTEKAEKIVNLSKLKHKNNPLKIDSYSFNSNESKLLFQTATNAIYRHSFTANYFLYDLKAEKLIPLDEQHQPQSHAEYSPDGTKVAFIFENNLYVKDLIKNKTKQITHDGRQNEVINGMSDWVYEEEFSITKTYFWSPDSKKIAFLKFNEKKVKSFSLDYYANQTYPITSTFKYPKAGEDNSIVSAHIAELEHKRIKNLDLGKYEYIPRLIWMPSMNHLVVLTMNRHQNKLNYFLIQEKEKGYESTMFYEEKDEKYIEIDDNIYTLNDNVSILRTSEINGYNHIYRLETSGKQTAITSGNYDVIEFLGIDQNLQQIYFTAARKNALSKGIYSIKSDGTNLEALTTESGYNDANFTYGFNYFIHTHSDANTPPTFTLRNRKGELIKVLEDNAELLKTMAKYKLATKEFFEIKTKNGKLNASIIKPKDFDPSKKYPVYIYVYGGPHRNVVTDSYAYSDYMYHQLLAQKGYIVISIDPRGTMYRGSEFKKATYLQLGKLECEDMIESAKILKTWSYVDSNRIGIQGWSFGGYLSSLALLKGNEQFKMGIAIAPVTNWKFYDNIYTERYLRTPQENPTGYEENSPVNFAQQLKGNYLLIHGVTDDNVHFQNSLEMMNALINNNKQFTSFVYPNKNHSISGSITRTHLYNMLLDYTLKHL